MTSKWSFWRDWIFLIGFLCRSNSLETRSFFLCAGPRQMASRSQKLGVGFPPVKRLTSRYMFTPTFPSSAAWYPPISPPQPASRCALAPPSVLGFPFPNRSCLLSASRQSPSPPLPGHLLGPLPPCSWIVLFFFFGCVGSSLLSTGLLQGFPGVSDSKESACSSRDLVLIPGSGRSPWRREWQPTSVSSPGESHGQRSPARLQSLRSQSPADKHFHFSIPPIAGSGGCSLVLVCGLLAAQSMPQECGLWKLQHVGSRVQIQ